MLLILQVPLFLSKSMVFRTLCTAFFSIVTLGVTHGLVLLPVLLSYCGAQQTEGHGDGGDHKKEIRVVKKVSDLSILDEQLSYDDQDEQQVIWRRAANYYQEPIVCEVEV